jgi:anionic cell wall polymer biosynthesis LytR-Cps2A-Psr (LCP) family protein
LIVLPLLAAAAFYVAIQAQARFKEFTDQLGPIFVTPIPAPATPAPTPDALKEPLNILLLGLDRRAGEEDTRNDVNLLAHVNPEQGFVTMLSIPRDTRVDIPGHGAHKINAAYNLGSDHSAEAGGGPALAKRAVEEFLELPIHYYTEVDLAGFERIVDLLGASRWTYPLPL